LIFRASALRVAFEGFGIFGGSLVQPR
jgi:hypothetical protein